MAEKTRYSDEELEEFRAIINEKLRLARRDFNSMMDQLRNTDGNGIEDTSPTYKALEEGSASQSKEEIAQMANRQQKFIQGLEAALVRVENKTYGITALLANSFRRNVFASYLMLHLVSNLKMHVKSSRYYKL